MICCAGLLIGLLLAQPLGGFWTTIGAGSGFALGLLVDWVLLRARPTGRTNDGEVRELRFGRTRQVSSCCYSTTGVDEALRSEKEDK